MKLLHLENFIEFESCVCVREREREREMGICNVNLEKEQCWVGVVGMCLQVTKYTQVSEIEEKPRDGCYITGLYLEGASWDEKISMLRVQVQRSTHTHTHTHTQQTHKNISKVMFLSSLSSSSSSSSSSSQHNN